MKELLFASTNKGKLREMQEIASRFQIKILNPADFVDRFGPVPDVIEGHTSYRENALKKARAFHAWSNLPTLSDDTGLEVEALSGAPGVTSARYAGESATMEQNKALLLKNLENTPNRSAQFRCVLCYVDKEVTESFYESTLSGSIALSENGTGGFGYDSLFLVEGKQKTLSQLKEDGFNDTHRARAFALLAETLFHPANNFG